MGFKFTLITPDGDAIDSIETNEANWAPGDTVIADGNRHFRGDRGRAG